MAALAGEQIVMAVGIVGCQLATDGLVWPPVPSPIAGVSVLTLGTSPL